MKQRIDWIDAAKGVSIVGTIISHTAPPGSMARTLLFSFHMPLFFILSGFTMTPATDWNSFKKKTIKDIRSLIIPLIIFSLIRCLFRIIQSNDYSLVGIQSVVKEWIWSSIWSSGTPVHGHINFGMLWFLVSLFTARIIFNLIHILFKDDKNESIPLTIGLGGILLGAFGHYLILNFDVSLACLFFIALGYLVKQKFKFIQKQSTIILWSLALVWIYAIFQNYYIEMSMRGYEHGPIVLIEAVAGTFMVCSICKALCNHQRVKRILTYIGANSLYVLCFHNIDFIAEKLWLNHSPVLGCVIRVALVLSLALTYSTIKHSIRRKKDTNRQYIINAVLLSYC